MLFGAHVVCVYIYICIMYYIYIYICVCVFIYTLYMFRERLEKKIEWKKYMIISE